MNQQRFDKAFANFIKRSREKISPRTFFQILAEIERERTQRTIELQAKIVEGKLQFQPSPEISVHENEILLDTQRIVVKVT